MRNETCCSFERIGLTAWMILGLVLVSGGPARAAESDSVAVWPVMSRKLPQRLRKVVPAEIVTLFSESADWTLVEPEKKQSRALAKLERRCKPTGGAACAQQVGETVGVSHVLVARFGRVRKALEFTLALVKVETGEEIASTSGQFAADKWRDEIIAATKKLLDPPVLAATDPTPPPSPTPAPDASAGDQDKPDTAVVSLPVEPAPSPDSDSVQEVTVRAAEASVGGPESTPSNDPEIIAASSVESKARVTVDEVVIGAETSGPADQDQLFPVSVGVEVGGSFSQVFSDLGTSVTFHLEGAYLIPILDQRLAVFGGVGYVMPQHKDESADPRVPNDTYDYKITEHELVFAVGPMFRLFPPETLLNFYGQAGLQVRLQRADVQGKAGSGFGENSETATKVGAMLAGGVEYHLGPGAIAAELDFSFADLNHRVTGNSTAGGLALQVGYHFLF